MVRVFVTLLALLLGAFEAAAVNAVEVEPTPTLLVPSAHQGGLEGGIKLLATHPRSSWFATLGLDGTLCIWDAVDAHFLAKHPATEVQALAILPNSHLAVVASIDTLRILDVDTFATVKTVAVPVPISQLFSTPDGQLFALTYRGLDRIDPTTLALTPLAAIESGLIQRAAMSPDGNRVGVVLTGTDANHQHLVIFDTRNGTTQLAKDVSRVNAIDLSSDLVVIGSKDSDDIRVSEGQILALHLPDGHPVIQLPVEHFSFALQIAPGESTNGRLHEVLSAYPGGTDRVDLTTSKITLQVAQRDTFSYLAPLGTSVIAAGFGGVPNVCDATTLHCVAAVAIHGSAVMQVRTQGKDGLLLFDSQGDAIRMSETLQIDKLYPPPTLALLPKLKGQEGVFALGQSSDILPGVFVNSALAPTHPAAFLMIAHSVTLAASGDGRYLATRAPFTQTNPLRAEIYDLSKLTNEPFAAPPQLGTWELTSEQAAPIDVRDEYQFRFTSDSKLLVAVNVMTGSIHRYEVATGHELPVVSPPPPAITLPGLGPGRVSAWSLRADGKSVVLARYRTLQIIRFDDVRSATSIATKELIENVATGDGDGMYISLEDGSVLRWDTTSEPVPLTTLPNPSTSLLYLPERKWLLANSADGNARFLDAESGRELMSVMLFPNGKDWLLWTPNGLFDASDGGWSGLRWKLAPNTFSASESVEDFFDQFYAPGLAAAVLNGATLEPSRPLALKERRTATIHLTPGQPAGGKVSIDLLATAPPTVAIRDIHLFRNGVLLKTWSGSVRAGSHLKYTADLVAGPNRFRAYAFNQSNVKTPNAIAEVPGPETLRRPGELYVVAIGINEYQNKSFHLNYARQDALITAAALKAQRQDIKLVATQIAARPEPPGDAQQATSIADLMPSSGDIHITTLVDADATRDRILKTLSDVSRQVRPEDSLIIYYAGHGIAVGDRYYLLPQDLEFNGAPGQLRENAGDVLERSAISDINLADVLSGEQAATAALIIDACQSGEITGDKLAQHRGPANSRGLIQLAYDKRIYVLAASLSTQSAAEQQELGQGVLTYRLAVEGLLQDKASPDQNGVGPGTTTLAQWLSWVASNAAPGTTQAGAARGFLHAQSAANLRIPVQQPRLFAPPELESEPPPQITVALRALPLDPQTLTAEGYIRSQTATPPSIHPSPVRTEVSYHPSTLGWMRSGVVSADGHGMIGVSDNRIVDLDLDHGAVRWTQKMDEDLVSLDVSYNGEIAVLGQSGKVSVVTHSATPETRELLPGFGYTPNGLVRWVGRDGGLLVLTDQLLALYTPRGELVHSINLSGKGLRAPILSAHGDWLFAEDGSGKLLSYQVPSLTPGPVVESVQPNSSAPGAILYSISSAVDPSGRHLIRVRNDGSLIQTLLPQEPDSHPLIQSGRTQAVHFSADGSRLFVADSAGTLRVIDTSSGSELKSWPSKLETVETLASDAAGTVLVAMGNGAAAVWKLPGGELQTLIPGGRLLTTARPVDGGSVNMMMADHDSVRTFHLPDAAVTSSVARPPGVFLNHNRLGGKTGTALAVWDVDNVSHLKQLTVPAGEGRLDITPDGRLLAWTPNPPAAASLQVLDTSRGATVKSITLPVSPDAFALSANGQWLMYLLGEHLHEIPLDGGPATEILVPQAPCCEMELSDAGSELLLASAQQGRVMLYDLDKRKVRRTLQMRDRIETANFVPSTDDVVAVTFDGDVHLWKPSTTEEPQRLGTVEGHVTGVGFTRSASTVLVSSDRGEMGWFSLGGVDRGQLATTTWLESTHSWLTVANDGRFEVTGDISTPLAILEAEHSTWQPASQLPGFTPGLLKQLAAR